MKYARAASTAMSKRKSGQRAALDINQGGVIGEPPAIRSRPSERSRSGVLNVD
jgi:hypothetical protein